MPPQMPCKRSSFSSGNFAVLPSLENFLFTSESQHTRSNGLVLYCRLELNFKEIASKAVAGLVQVSVDSSVESGLLAERTGIPTHFSIVLGYSWELRGCTGTCKHQTKGKGREEPRTATSLLGNPRNGCVGTYDVLRD